MNDRLEYQSIHSLCWTVVACAGLWSCVPSRSDAPMVLGRPEAHQPTGTADPTNSTVPGRPSVPGASSGGSLPNVTFPPGLSWQIQLSGPIDHTVDARVYDVDLYDVGVADLVALRAAGRRVICYFSAGTREDWRVDALSFPPMSVGLPMEGWPGERWLDIRSPELRQILLARLDFAAQRGCDAVDADNVDGYTHPTGFQLTADDQLDFNRFLAREAHARGLKIGLKNALELIPVLAVDFDFAINEECWKFDECDKNTPFIEQNKAVYNIEYGDSELIATVCPQANALQFDAVIKNLDLKVFRIACR